MSGHQLIKKHCPKRAAAQKCLTYNAARSTSLLPKPDWAKVKLPLLFCHLVIEGGRIERRIEEGKIRKLQTDDYCAKQATFVRSLAHKTKLLTREKLSISPYKERIMDFLARSRRRNKFESEEEGEEIKTIWLHEFIEISEFNLERNRWASFSSCFRIFLKGRILLLLTLAISGNLILLNISTGLAKNKTCPKFSQPQIEIDFDNPKWKVGLL